VSWKIATWNVNGIRAREAQVCQWLSEESPDVVCLQEIKASPDQVPITLYGDQRYYMHWHGHKGYSGVALLLRKERLPSAPRFEHPPFDLENRIVVSAVGELVFASVYVPNGGKDFAAKMTFLTEMEAWAARLAQEGRRLVLCGDMNVARTERDVHPRERKPVTGQLPEERALFESMLTRGALVDVGRALAPDDDGLFTWWAPWRNMRERNIGWRLDYVLASQSLFTAEARCRAYREVGTSDHAPVIAWL
jgi:exodeoxyribonuclease-3